LALLCLYCCLKEWHMGISFVDLHMELFFPAVGQLVSSLMNKDPELTGLTKQQVALPKLLVPVIWISETNVTWRNSIFTRQRMVLKDCTLPGYTPS